MSDPPSNSVSRPPLAGISILIAAHNRCELLAQCLDSLAALGLPALPVECIVIANACTDDTEGVVARAARKFPFPLRVVAEPRRGVSFARNRAVVEASHDLLVFIDSDCRAEPGWLLEHLRMYTEHGADLVTGRIELWWEAQPAPAWLSQSMLEALGQHRFSEQPRQLAEPRAYAANFSFRREVARRVAAEQPDGQPFRTDIGRSGALGRLAHEEAVFARRAMELGFAFWWTPAAVVHHWAPQTSLSDAFFARSAYWGSVSFMLTAEPMPTPRILLTAFKSWVRAHICVVRLLAANLRASPGAASIARMDLNGALGRLHGAWSRLTGRNIPKP